MSDPHFSVRKDGHTFAMTLISLVIGDLDLFIWGDSDAQPIHLMQVVHVSLVEGLITGMDFPRIKLSLLVVVFVKRCIQFADLYEGIKTL